MDLNRDAMLVGLRITAWSGRLYDREASDHVAAHHDASASAGRYNKRLLPKAAFAALTATMSEARTKHYENSLPWDDKGGRLLTRRDLSRYPWIDFDWPATPSPGDGRPSLDALLEGLGATVPTRVKTVLRAGTAGLLLMAGSPYLAWLSLTFLDRLPGAFLRPLPVRFGRYPYRTGFVARRSAEDLAPLRQLEAIVRDIALSHPG